ncbi:protein kinase [Streptomyces sp. NPDC088337]|uniref:serine/threonine-protein kinase n=1 Tax=unclassified Streptomyces TaxID=2593676 RepID=UPI002DD7F30A|nr:protein kinase [Streptomyces sp. NBC_01788]WSB27861.1 protein kinase [Streptomyces sp. NBC_01788]
MQRLGPGDPQRIGAYRLLARLGAGGMGQVFLARSDRGRTVAVKLVRRELAQQEEFRARFRQEVRAARQVGGHWTAPVLDADTEAAVPWLATGYVAGPSLQRVVGRDHGPLPERSVRILAAGLAGALKDIHAAGLIHRDLKPSNVLVTIDGPRVIDFGIARALETVTEGGLTRTGALVGSPGFMAPEQVRGDRITTACDVFCLGSILAYAATGVLPFGGVDSGVHALMYRIAEKEPDLQALPEGIADLVRACLRKDPAARPTVDRIIQRTGAEDTIADGRLRDPWLPGALVAQLGRHAVQLLNEENPENPEDTGDPGETPDTPPSSGAPGVPGPVRGAPPVLTKQPPGPGVQAPGAAEAAGEPQAPAAPEPGTPGPAAPDAHEPSGAPGVPVAPGFAPGAPAAGTAASGVPGPHGTSASSGVSGGPGAGGAPGAPGPYGAPASSGTPGAPGAASAAPGSHGASASSGTPSTSGAAAAPAGFGAVGAAPPGAPGPHGPSVPPGASGAPPPPAPGPYGYPHQHPHPAAYGYPQQHPQAGHHPYGALGRTPGRTPPYGPPPVGSTPSYGPSRFPEREPRRSGRSTAALVAVALVVALGAGGSVYVLMRGGGDSDHKGGAPGPTPAVSASTHDATGPDGSDPSPEASQQSPSPSDGAVPTGYLGSWTATIDNAYGSNNRRLTITQGDVGDSVLTLVADGPIDSGGTYHCVFEARLTRRPGDGGPLEIGPSVVTSGRQREGCNPGAATQVVLLPDGTLQRVNTGTGEKLTYTRQ